MANLLHVKTPMQPIKCSINTVRIDISAIKMKTQSNHCLFYWASTP